MGSSWINVVMAVMLFALELLMACYFFGCVSAKEVGIHAYMMVYIH
jgi:hypothetical protein